MDMDLYRGRYLLSLVQVQEGPVVWVVLKQIEGTGYAIERSKSSSPAVPTPLGVETAFQRLGGRLCKSPLLWQARRR